MPRRPPLPPTFCVCTSSFAYSIPLAKQRLVPDLMKMCDFGGCCDLRDSHHGYPAEASTKVDINLPRVGSRRARQKPLGSPRCLTIFAGPNLMAIHAERDKAEAHRIIQAARFTHDATSVHNAERNPKRRIQPADAPLRLRV